MRRMIPDKLPFFIAAALVTLGCLMMTGCPASQLRQLRDSLDSVTQTIHAVRHDAGALQARLETLPDSEAKRKALAAVDTIQTSTDAVKVADAAIQFQAALDTALQTADADGGWSNVDETLIVAGEASSALSFLSPWLGLVGVVLGAIGTAIGARERRKSKDRDSTVEDVLTDADRLHERIMRLEASQAQKGKSDDPGKVHES